MLNLDLGVTITILAYLVIVTSYVVGLRKDLNHLKSNFDDLSTNISGLKELREDFIRLETKIEILLGIKNNSSS